MASREQSRAARARMWSKCRTWGWRLRVGLECLFFCDILALQALHCNLYERVNYKWWEETKVIIRPIMWDKRREERDCILNFREKERAGGTKITQHSVSMRLKWSHFCRSPWVRHRRPPPTLLVKKCVSYSQPITTRQDTSSSSSSSWRCDPVGYNYPTFTRQQIHS